MRAAAAARRTPSRRPGRGCVGFDQTDGPAPSAQTADDLVHVGVARLALLGGLQAEIVDPARPLGLPHVGCRPAHRRAVTVDWTGASIRRRAGCVATTDAWSAAPSTTQ